MAPSVDWDPASDPRVRAAVASACGRGGRRVATFDFDNTLLYGDLGDATFYRLAEERRLVVDDGFWQRVPERYGRDALRRWYEAAAHLPRHEARRHPSHTRWVGGLLGVYRDATAEEGTRVSYPLLTRLHAGLPREFLRDFARETLDLELELDIHSWEYPALDDTPATIARGLRPYAALRQLVSLLDAAGFEVWIVTASPRDVVAAVSARFGVSADRVVGMDLHDDGGVLSDRLTDPVTCYEGKVEAIDRVIGVRPAIAAGDSVSDESMLGSATDLAVLVDRGRADLRERLAARGALVRPVLEGSP